MKSLQAFQIGFILTCLPWLLIVDAAGKPNIVVIVADDLGDADELFNPRNLRDVTTQNLYTWLAQMPDLIKAGGKSWTSGKCAARRSKLTPIQKPKARQ